MYLVNQRELVTILCRIHTLNVYFLLGYTLGLLRSVIRIYVGSLSCIVYLE